MIAESPTSVAKRNLSPAKIAKVFKLTSGNISETARRLDVTRNAIYAWIKQSPELAQALEDEREALVDMAEAALRQEVAAGNITAIIWTLKASPAARSRGWGERQIQDHGGGLTFRVVYGDEGDGNSDSVT